MVGDAGGLGASGAWACHAAPEYACQARRRLGAEGRKERSKSIVSPWVRSGVCVMMTCSSPLQHSCRWPGGWVGVVGGVDRRQKGKKQAPHLVRWWVQGRSACFAEEAPTTQVLTHHSRATCSHVGSSGSSSAVLQQAQAGRCALGARTGAMKAGVAFRSAA